MTCSLNAHRLAWHERRNPLHAGRRSILTPLAGRHVGPESHRPRQRGRRGASSPAVSADTWLPREISLPRRERYERPRLHDGSSSWGQLGPRPTVDDRSPRILGRHLGIPEPPHRSRMPSQDLLAGRGSTALGPLHPLLASCGRVVRLCSSRGGLGACAGEGVRPALTEIFSKIGLPMDSSSADTDR